jgi:hypothetical protein
LLSKLSPEVMMSPRLLVPAVGQSGSGSAPFKAAEALAAKLGVKTTVFPGGHMGWLLRPKGFGAKLKEVQGA